MKTLLLSSLIFFLLPAGKEASPPHHLATRTTRLLPLARPSDVQLVKQETPPASADVKLPVNFERHIGDLDDMVKRRTIRALVVINPIGFFYEGGLPRGVMYEALNAFQTFVNQKLKTGAFKIEV